MLNMSGNSVCTNEHSNEIHLLLQLQTCTFALEFIRTHRHTYLDTCDMLTTVACCVCVLQGSLQQPIERLDPILDRINEELGRFVSGCVCGIQEGQ